MKTIEEVRELFIRMLDNENVSSISIFKHDNDYRSISGFLNGKIFQIYFCDGELEISETSECIEELKKQFKL